MILLAHGLAFYTIRLISLKPRRILLSNLLIINLTINKGKDARAVSISVVDTITSKT